MKLMFGLNRYSQSFVLNADLIQFNGWIKFEKKTTYELLCEYQSYAGVQHISVSYS